MSVSERPYPRAAIALALVSLWLVLLFTGNVWGGVTHGLLGLALVVFPWRALRA